jgi:hypothetical protein
MLHEFRNTDSARRRITATSKGKQVGKGKSAKVG